jgi:hypothetical protein
MAKFNEYTVKATPEDADTLMLYDAASKTNKLSPFSGIWNWMVNKLTNAVINNLQTSNKTVVGALNELNSNLYVDVTNKKSFSITIKLEKSIFNHVIIYGATESSAFMYLVFIDTLSNGRRIVFNKIFENNSDRTFTGNYDDTTDTLTITSSTILYGGLKALTIK